MGQPEAGQLNGEVLSGQDVQQLPCTPTSPASPRHYHVEGSDVTAGDVTASQVLQARDDVMHDAAEGCGV